MLVLSIGVETLFHEKTLTFSQTEGKGEIHLEHSLAALSKWESITQKPFFEQKEGLLGDDLMLYIECMTLNDPDLGLYKELTNAHLNQVQKYINSPMTATTFPNTNEPHKARREFITAEIIYYQMFSYGIPLECEHWHLGRLLTLINVFSVKNSDKKEMSKADIYEQQRKQKEAYDKQMEEENV